ncbi:arginine-tRNA-protein transferase 1 [Xylariales sp. PMI_506]|nr:arginine-tRNA-protein transferase 1 [Xylariales sp. PMI_506]
MATPDMQTTPEDAFSYISPIGYRSSSTCGYCRRRTQTGHSFYARATSLSPAFYQSLVDRCWRRSGKLLYKPNQRDACCPHYTLRLDSFNCHVAKDQRQAINRFNKYILGDDYIKEAARLYPRSRAEARQRDTEFNLIERIHEAETRFVQNPPRAAHTFEVTLEPDKFTEEKYAVFENYQRVVHHEEPSQVNREGFKRFLCDSPLRREVFTAPDGKQRQLGSFHQCYRIDGQLVAIGVLDLLPECVSAKYFLYHESIHRFQPGKLGALREIALAAEQGYRWWYSGFYIHTCPKMRYKIDFKPQYVLDPDRYDWISLEKDILDKFNSKGYLQLSRPTSPVSENRIGEIETESVDIDSASADSTVTAGESDDDDHELPLFKSNMPGLPSIDMMQRVPLDIIPVRLTKGIFSAGDLFQWNDEAFTDPRTAKGMVAELVAAVGPDLVLQWALDFRKS